MIIDPTDPQQAITPSGRLAARVYILADPRLPGAPVTQADLDRAIFIGHTEPVWTKEDE